MNKKLFIILALIAVTGVIGIGSVVAKGLFINPEIQALSQKNTLDKTKGMDVLKEEESRMLAKQNINMSKGKKDAVIQEKERGHKERIKEIASYVQTSVQPEKSSFSGIVEGIDVPAPFRSDEFTVLNFWGGEIDGKAIGVYAGYRPDNPLQGVVVVFDDKNNSKGKFYSAPKSTGPVRIISESNGILALKSISGEFEVYDSSKKVQALGQTAYSFDVRKQIFK